MNIPLLIINFNQLTYLRNLINWFRYYYPKNDVIVIDNHSTYPPLLDFYSRINEKDNIKVFYFSSNEAKLNLCTVVKEMILNNYEYFIVSDPDIMPHPSTPMNFLDIFKYCIDTYGYHHVGFCLKIDDLPDYLEDKEKIIKHESVFWKNPIEIVYKGKKYKAYKAPIDTAFALYKTSTLITNSFEAFWKNVLRIFHAFHLGWYIDPQAVTEEMDYYFKTTKHLSFGDSIEYSLLNTWRPKKYISKNQ